MKKLLITLAVLLFFVTVQAQEFVNMSDRPGYVALKKWGWDKHDVTLRNPIKFSDGTSKKLYGVGPHAFEGLKSLEVVTFYEGEFDNEEVLLGNECFRGCTSLQYLTLPQNIRKIPNGCFRDCTGLLFFRLPNDVETIEDFAFAGCSKLQTIQTLSPKPKKLKSGGNLAFQGVLIVPKGHGDFYVNPQNGWAKYFPRVREDGDTKDYVSKNPSIIAATKPYCKMNNFTIDEGGKSWQSNLYRGLTIVFDMVVVNLPSDDVWVTIYWWDANGKPLPATDYTYQDSKGQCCHMQRYYTNYNDPAKFSNLHVQCPYNAVHKGWGSKTVKYQVQVSGLKTGIIWKSQQKTITIVNRPKPRNLR